MGGFLDFIGNIVPITGDSFIDTILFFIIGGIAFSAGWAAGKLAEGDSEGMSCIHWFVRIFVFLGLLTLAIGIVWLVKLIRSIEWWVWIIISVSLIHIIVGAILIHKSRKKKKEFKDASAEQEI